MLVSQQGWERECLELLIFNNYRLKSSVEAFEKLKEQLAVQIEEANHRDLPMQSSRPQGLNLPVPEDADRRMSPQY